MWSKRGGLGFAEDVSKVVVFLGHTREIGVLAGGEANAEQSFASLDIQCEVCCSWKFAGVHKCGSTYQQNIESGQGWRVKNQRRIWRV